MDANLLAQVRDDLEQLSADMKAARDQWRTDREERMADSTRASAHGRQELFLSRSKQRSFDAPPLERIVLYIDDLDRCQPSRGVEVLEAVHLLLALDLFVVVMAVDARWLVQSLEYHHRKLFRSDGGYRREPPATPVDYLDKIFQVPFVLLPPAPEAAGEYVRSLLPEPTAAPEGMTEAISIGPSAAKTASAETEDNETSGAGSLPAQGTSQEDSSIAAADSETPDESTGAPAAPEAGETILQIAEATPREMEITEAEVAFMAGLGQLRMTPRSLKRLVNLYRLVRINVPDQELNKFLDDNSYQAVQALLAVLVGHPSFAERLFREILQPSEPDNSSDLCALAEKIKQGSSPDSASMFTTVERDEQSAQRVLDLLTSFKDRYPAVVDLDLARRWCPELARFSFHTWSLATGIRLSRQPP